LRLKRIQRRKERIARIIARRNRRRLHWQKIRMARKARAEARRLKRIAFLKKLRSLRKGHLFSKKTIMFD